MGPLEDDDLRSHFVLVFHGMEKGLNGIIKISEGTIVSLVDLLFRNDGDGMTKCKKWQFITNFNYLGCNGNINRLKVTELNY